LSRGAARILACFLILLSSILTPTARAEGSRLIIHRAANFGTQMWLRIRIDGSEFEAIAVGHDFDVPISPGRHLITVQRLPKNSVDEGPTRRVINVAGGQTYEFTALNENEHVVLRKNDQS
jgi:hypothetical protein